MTKRTALFLAALGIAGLLGCYTGTATDVNRTPGLDAKTSTDGTEPAPTDPGAEVEGGLAATGLPCEVAELFERSCTGCHGHEPSGGAPNRLVTYDDLASPSDADPSTSVAALSLARMKATRRPMPPDGALPAADVAILERWIADGLPRGTCGAPSTEDGGVDSGKPSKPADAGADAKPQASVCSSGITAEAGAPPSPFMKPGRSCIACHSATGGPNYSFAGTVYKTLREPNDCQGVNSGVSILLIDAVGVSHTIPVNAAGNFYRVTSMPLPYRAMVVRGNSVREMKTPQTDGDCNGCHSELGKGAPGRVMAP